MFVCDYCNKDFKTQPYLNSHQKKIKTCLRTQKKNIEIFKIPISCDFCKKELSSKDVLKTHLVFCKKTPDNILKKVNNLKKQIEKYKEEIENYKKKIEKVQLNKVPTSLTDRTHLLIYDDKDVEDDLAKFNLQFRKIGGYTLSELEKYKDNYKKNKTVKGPAAIIDDVEYKEEFIKFLQNDDY
jgi:uncharacterized Zn-finger protein